MKTSFSIALEKRWKKGKYICVGLDSSFEKLPRIFHKQTPDKAILSFNKAIIDATHDLVSAYKPNVAYYEALGNDGFLVLKKTVEYVKTKFPDIPLILDAKRADIGSTNIQYTKAIFDYLGFDAVTVNPYLGKEAIQPFLDRKDKGIIILVKTSNPGSGEFQDLIVNNQPLWKYVASAIATEWNQNDNCSIVVGATYPKDLAVIRKIVKDMPILLPGVGTQGGDLTASVKAGKGNKTFGLIINAARSVLYASSGHDFAEKARQEVIRLTQQVETAL